jgi:multiple sugar transport system permease protein
MAQTVQTTLPQGGRSHAKVLGNTPVEWREIGVGVLFALPWIIGFLAFTIVPLASSLYYSFTRYDVIGDPVFIGLRNYVNLFLNDEDFHNVVYNTLWWVLISSP